MTSIEITKGIYYVGVNDRTTSKFEGIWPLPYGVSYNSYVVKGSEKTALIDGVEISHAYQQIGKIKKICGDIKLDYLVVNHMEPDHSGAIISLMNIFPELQIIGNSKTIEMLNGYYGITDRTITITDGQEIDLGCNEILSHPDAPLAGNNDDIHSTGQSPFFW